MNQYSILFNFFFAEEEIDVVSLGEVLRMNPSGTMTTSLNSSSSSKSLASSVSTAGHTTLGSANNSHAPLRLKLKGRSIPEELDYCHPDSLDCRWIIVRRDFD